MVLTENLNGGCVLFSGLSGLKDNARSVQKASRYLGQTMRLMVGVPDYETYVEHRRATHPDLPVMSYEEFFRDRQDARYKCGKGGCC